MILEIPDHVWTEMRAKAQEAADDVMREMMQHHLSNFVEVTTLDDEPGTTKLLHAATGRVLIVKAAWQDGDG